MRVAATSVTITLLGLSMVTAVAGAPPAAAAVTLMVNSTADDGDSNRGNGVCATSGGQCTLRAAIEEANALPGMDAITVPAGTYSVSEQLVIEDSVSINGAGMTSTLVDGGGASELLRARTLEALICDSGHDSIASYDPNGQRNVDFTSG